MSIETDPNSIFNCPQTICHIFRTETAHFAFIRSCSWAHELRAKLRVGTFVSFISDLGSVMLGAKGQRRERASGHNCSEREIKGGVKEVKITDETNVGWWSRSKLSWKWDHGFLLSAVVHYYWPLCRPIRMRDSHVGGAKTPARAAKRQWKQTL